MRNLPATSLILSVLAVSAVSDSARASGPVERLVQVLNDPSDPKHVVVRYGLASEGYLFSRDGGKTFKAMCSQAITPTAAESAKLKRISSRNVPSLAATLLDNSGKLLVGQLDGLWSDDGTGCTWSKVPALDGKWVYHLRRDPKNPAELLALVNEKVGPDENQASLWRRSADGAWASVGLLKKQVAMQLAYGSELAGVGTASGERLYATVNVTVGPAATAAETMQLVTSEDGGKTWTDASTIPAAQKEDFLLLAVDPLEPKRVLAVQYRDGAEDTLLLSEDAGKTFASYGEVGETRGVTFAPDGRVFVGDAGSSTGGGVWTAPRLGQPLTLISGSMPVDCIEYGADGKLQVCVSSRFGSMDPATGAFEEFTSIVKTASLIECPGADMLAICQTQLNAGASWCCAGHYPFTPFCGEYDVTMFAGRKLYCGRSGRALDAENGLAPDDYDAGVSTDPSGNTGGKPRDAGTSDVGGGPAFVDAAPRKPDAGKTGTDSNPTSPTTTNTDGGGCACAVPTSGAGFGAGLSWLLAGLALLFVQARRSALAGAKAERVRARTRGSVRRPS